MSNRHKRSSSAVGKIMAKRAGRARRERLRKHGKAAGLRDGALHAWMKLEDPRERAAVLRSTRRLNERQIMHTDVHSGHADDHTVMAGVLHIHAGAPPGVNGKSGPVIVSIPCSAFKITP